MKLAKSYSGWNFDETKAYEKNGKLYVHATHTCDRCHKGVYVCRVENGQPVPHPAYGGVCLKCGGAGILSKEVRLYTDKEFDTMERANAKAAEKKKVESEKKMAAEFAAKKTIWLNENGFNENGETFVYFPSDSYQVKETLKAAGFKFNYTLLWHIAEVPAGYEDKVIPINLDEVAEIAAWGEGHYIIGAKDVVQEQIIKARPVNPSEWVGAVGEKISCPDVTITDMHGYETRFGYSKIIKFITQTGNIIKWFTSSNVLFEVGDVVSITATIKDCVEDKYEDGAKVTIVTRAKLKGEK